MVFFKSQETLNYGDNYFLVSKDKACCITMKGFKGSDAVV